MAQVVVTVEGKATDPAGGIIATLKYSVNAWPKPTKADLAGLTADATVTVKEVNAKEFTVTVPTVPTVPDSDPATIAIDLPGYESQNVGIDTGVTRLLVLAGHLAGGGYIIVTDTARTDAPTFPATAPARRNWSDHSDDTPKNMPDLYDHFQIDGGGTINLKLIETGADPNVRVGSRRGDTNAPDATHNRNQRQVVINEVMWAYDNALVGQATRGNQQWIEIHNRSTTPYAYANIRLSTSKEFPAPAAETDRLSNNPAYNNTWSLTGRGQHGNSGPAATDTKIEFISMERVNYDNGWEAKRWASAVELYLPNFKGTPGAQKPS